MKKLILFLGFMMGLASYSQQHSNNEWVVLPVYSSDGSKLLGYGASMTVDGVLIGYGDEPFKTTDYEVMIIDFMETIIITIIKDKRIVQIIPNEEAGKIINIIRNGKDTEVFVYMSTGSAMSFTVNKDDNINFRDILRNTYGETVSMFIPLVLENKKEEIGGLILSFNTMSKTAFNNQIIK